MSRGIWRLAAMLFIGIAAMHMGAPRWAAFMGSLICGYIAMPERD